MSDIQSTLRIQLDADAFMPTRAHPDDAGLDLRSRDLAIVPPGGYETVRTGVHVEIPPGWCGILVSKSGMNTRHGVTSTGLIDAGYTGEVVVALHNSGSLPHVIAAGDKVTQLVLVPCATPAVEVVPRIDGGERGDAGFGSSGR